MTTQAGIEDNEREFVLRCVGDAYQMLDLIPGVDTPTALPWCGLPSSSGSYAARTSPEHPPTT